MTEIILTAQQGQQLLDYLCGSYADFGQYIPDTTNELINILAEQLHGEPMFDANGELR